MAASFGIDLIIGVKNLASGSVKNLNNDLIEQKKRVFELRQEERLRASEAQKSIAAQKQKIATDNLGIKQAKSLAADKRAAFFNNPTEDAKAAKAKLQLLKAESTLSSAKERSLGLEKKIGIQAEATAVAQKSGISGFVSGITQGIVSAELLSSVISGGIGLAIQAATKGVELFSQQMASAIETTQQLIPATTQISKNFGVTRKEARSIVIEQQKQIEILGRELPVSGGDITNAYSIALNSGLASNVGGDSKVFNRLALGTSGDLGVLPLATLIKQQLGTQIKDAQFTDAIGRISTATKVSDLSQLEFFQKAGILPELKKLNFDDAKTGIQRLTIINSAFKNLVPPEAVAELQGSLPALFSNFTDFLFADRTGVLGFLRDIRPDIEGDQTIYDDVAKTIQLLIGKDGLFDQLGKLTNGVDPLVSLSNTIQGLNTFIADLNSTLNAISSIPGIKEIGGKILEISTYIGQSGGVGLAAIRSVTDTSRSIFGGITSQLTGGASKHLGTPFYSAANGFYGALSSEMLNKPPSSSIVFANSSENVFTQKQTENLVANSKAIGARSNKNINLSIEAGAITIQTTSDQNEVRIAEKAIELLTERINLKISSNYAF